jgi:hypothetical protein
MTINEAVTAIEKVLASMRDVAASQVRPSGDDVDVIKVWVNLGESRNDPVAWGKTLEADLRKQVPGAAPYRIEVRAETGVG